MATKTTLSSFLTKPKGKDRGSPRFREGEWVFCVLFASGRGWRVKLCEIQEVEEVSCKLAVLRERQHGSFFVDFNDIFERRDDAEKWLLERGLANS